ncbi:MAG: ribbon-helix-helix protein, CopG family [Acidimicrobiales bacterium]
MTSEAPKTYTTRTGKVLTDADIDAIATEVERGYDVEVLKARRRGRPMLGTAPSEVVPVRLDPELKLAVEARAEADQTTTSEVIREALRRFLDVA